MEKFFKKFGVNTTTNFQLLKWAKELGIPNFHVVMRDEIKNLPNGEIYTICNLHKKEQSGVHWSCFHRTENGENYYFDSYGLEPTKEVENILKPFTYSNYKLQNDEKFCGVLCLYVLFRLSQGDNFKNVIISMKNELKQL